MATIKDVAKLSGVSVTTVSRVMNNRGYISEKTKQIVFDAMKELDYQPNEIARSLFRNKTNIIGLIVPTVAHPFFGEIVSYIEYYAYKNDYKVLICNSQHEKNKEMDYVNMLQRNKVDGIILGSQTIEVEGFLDLKLPLVTLGRQFSDEIPSIASDNYQGGAIATKHLIESGCKKLAHISGNLKLNQLANKRYLAFKETCDGNEVTNCMIEACIDALPFNEYYDVIEKLFTENDDIDGVFASSDIIAAEVIQYCFDNKKSIPEDVRVVGYDDTNIASLTVPKLTTVKQPIEEIAMYAVDLLLKQISGELVPSKTVLPVSLVKRSST